MNHVQQAMGYLNRADAVASPEVAAVEALMGIGHALLAIHGELVTKDEVLPSRGLASVVGVMCKEDADGSESA